MGKFIVCGVCAVVGTWAIFNWIPSTAHPLFNVGPVAITGVMLVWLLFFYLAHRLTGK